MEHSPSPVRPEPSRGATRIGRIKEFRGRHARLESVLFFVGGFLFDAVMLNRIDEPSMLIQQGAYLLLSGAILALTQRYEHTGAEPPKLLRKVWRYADHLIHFMLGTLLNAYTIFYFQSASGLTALGFLVTVAFLLAVNEMPRFHRYGPVMLYGLLSICLTSYLAYLFPVLLGSIRPWMFYLAVLVALVPIAAHAHLLLRWTKDPRLVLRRALIPALGVQLAFVLLYALRIAPPVPLATKEMGIYHDVRREQGGRRLFHQSVGWKFWHHGDQDFLERPGDRAYCFARIFAPARFHDRIYVVWSFDDPRRGWQTVQRLPLSVSASGERGFATEAYLTTPAEGDWRVEVTSEDGRTMGLLRFTVTKDASTDPRSFEEEFSPTRAPSKGAPSKSPPLATHSE
jgi:hypothetical protein